MPAEPRPADPVAPARIDGRDPGADIVRLVGALAAVVGLVALLCSFLVLRSVLAVPLALVVTAAVVLVRARGIDERVAASIGARPLGPGEQPRLAGLVEAGAMAVGVQVPRLWVIDDDGANGIAWGSGTSQGNLAVTTGLLGALARIELEAVVAHLLTCLRDGIVAGPTVAAAVWGSGTRVLPPGVAGHAKPDADDRRVVRADLEGVRATRYPPGAVAALERLEAVGTAVARSPQVLQPLWVAPPAAPAADDPFAVHPTLADRADLLREL